MQRTGEDLCLEGMGESGNKGCNNWKRIEYYRIKEFTNELELLFIELYLLFLYVYIITKLLAPATSKID